MLFSRLNNQTYQSVTDGRTDRIPISTSVSETIRKPPLVKAQTALKTQKIWRKTILHMADGIITPCNVAWSWQERRNRSDLIEVFQMFSGYTEIDIKVLFTLDGNDKSLRGHSKKICKVRFNIDVRKYFFFKSCYWQMEKSGSGHCRCT